MKRAGEKRKYSVSLVAKASRLAFLLAQASVETRRCKRIYPKTTHQSKLRHHWTDLVAK